MQRDKKQIFEIPHNWTYLYNVYMHRNFVQSKLKFKMIAAFNIVC